MKKGRSFYWLFAAIVAIFSLNVWTSCSENDIAVDANGGNGGGGGGSIKDLDTAYVYRKAFSVDKRVIERIPTAEMPDTIRFTDYCNVVVRQVYTNSKTGTYNWDTTFVDQVSRVQFLMKQKEIIFRKNLDFSKNPIVTKVKNADNNQDVSYLIDYGQKTVNKIRTTAKSRIYSVGEFNVPFPVNNCDTVIPKAFNPTDLKDTVINKKTYHQHLVKFTYEGRLIDNTKENIPYYRLVLIPEDGVLPDDPVDPDVVSIEPGDGKCTRTVGEDVLTVWSHDSWAWPITLRLTDGSAKPQIDYKRETQSVITKPILGDSIVDSFECYLTYQSFGSYVDNKSEALYIVNGTKIPFSIKRDTVLYKYGSLSAMLKTGYYTGLTYVNTTIVNELPEKDGMEGRKVAHNFVTEYTDKLQPQNFPVYQNLYKRINSGSDKLIGLEMIDTATVFRDGEFFFVGKVIRKLENKDNDTIDIDLNLEATVEFQPEFTAEQDSRFIALSEWSKEKEEKTTFKEGNIRGMRSTRTIPVKYDNKKWGHSIKARTLTDLMYYEYPYQLKIKTNVWRFEYNEYEQVETPVTSGTRNVYASKLKYIMRYCEESFDGVQPVNISVSKEDDKAKLIGLEGKNLEIIEEEGIYYSVCDAIHTYSDGKVETIHLKYDLKARYEFKKNECVEQDDSKVNLSSIKKPVDTITPLEDGDYTGSSLERVLEFVFGKWSVQINTYGCKELVYRKQGFSIKMLTNEWSGNYVDYTQAEPTVDGNFDVYATILNYYMKYGTFDMSAKHDVEIAVKKGESSKTQTGLRIDNQQIIVRDGSKILTGTRVRTFDVGEEESSPFEYDLGVSFEVQDKFRVTQKEATVVMNEAPTPTQSFTDLSENIYDGKVTGKNCTKVFTYKYDNSKWKHEVTAKYKTLLTYSEGQFSVKLLSSAWSSSYKDYKTGTVFTEGDLDIYPTDLNINMTYNNATEIAVQPVEIAVSNPNHITNITGHSFRLYQENNRWISEFMKKTEYSKADPVEVLVKKDLNVSITNQPKFSKTQKAKEIASSNRSENEMLLPINSANFTGVTRQTIITTSFDNNLWSNEITVSADEPIYTEAGFEIKMLHGDWNKVTYTNYTQGNMSEITIDDDKYLSYPTTLTYNASYNNVAVPATQDMNVNVLKPIEINPEYGPIDKDMLGKGCESDIYFQDRNQKRRAVTTFFEKGMRAIVFNGNNMETLFFAYADGYSKPGTYGSLVINVANNAWNAADMRAVTGFGKNDYKNGWEYKCVQNGNESLVSSISPFTVSNFGLSNPLLSTKYTYNPETGVYKFYCADGTVITDR